MKQINLTSAEIKEVTIVPNKSISILYQVLDDAGSVIINNRITILKEDLPTAGQNAMNNLTQKLLENVIIKEGI